MAGCRDQSYLLYSYQRLPTKRWSPIQLKNCAHQDCAEVSGAAAALNNAATLRLGLMLAEMLLRGAALVAASQAGAESDAALAS